MFKLGKDTIRLLAERRGHKAARPRSPTSSSESPSRRSPATPGVSTLSSVVYSVALNCAVGIEVLDTVVCLRVVAMKGANTDETTEGNAAITLSLQHPATVVSTTFVFFEGLLAASSSPTSKKQATSPKQGNVKHPDGCLFTACKNGLLVVSAVFLASHFDTAGRSSGGWSSKNSIVPFSVAHCRPGEPDASLLCCVPFFLSPLSQANPNCYATRQTHDKYLGTQGSLDRLGLLYEDGMLVTVDHFGLVSLFDYCVSQAFLDTCPPVEGDSGSSCLLDPHGVVLLPQTRHGRAAATGGGSGSGAGGGHAHTTTEGIGHVYIRGFTAYVSHTHFTFLSEGVFEGGSSRQNGGDEDSPPLLFPRAVAFCSRYMPCPLDTLQTNDVLDTTMLVGGKHPALSAFPLRPGNPEISVAEVFAEVASKITATAKNFVYGFFGGKTGSEASKQEADPALSVFQRPSRVSTQIPLASLFGDDPVTVEDIQVDPTHHYAALLDKIHGRVYILDIASGCLSRVFKGVRAAQCCWMVPEINGRTSLVLVLYFGIRGVVEMHNLSQRTRIAARKVGTGCRLHSDPLNPKIAFLGFPDGQLDRLVLHPVLSQQTAHGSGTVGIAVSSERSKKNSTTVQPGSAKVSGGMLPSVDSFVFPGFSSVSVEEQVAADSEFVRKVQAEIAPGAFELCQTPSDYFKLVGRIPYDQWPLPAVRIFLLEAKTSVRAKYLPRPSDIVTLEDAWRKATSATSSTASGSDGHRKPLSVSAAQALNFIELLSVAVQQYEVLRTGQSSELSLVEPSSSSQQQQPQCHQDPVVGLSAPTKASLPTAGGSTTSFSSLTSSIAPTSHGAAPSPHSPSALLSMHSTQLTSLRRKCAETVSSSLTASLVSKLNAASVASSASSQAPAAAGEGESTNEDTDEKKADREFLPLSKFLSFFDLGAYKLRLEDRLLLGTDTTADTRKMFASVLYSAEWMSSAGGSEATPLVPTPFGVCKIQQRAIQAIGLPSAAAAALWCIFCLNQYSTVRRFCSVVSPDVVVAVEKLLTTEQLLTLGADWTFTAHRKANGEDIGNDDTEDLIALLLLHQLGRAQQSAEVDALVKAMERIQTLSSAQEQLRSRLNNEEIEREDEGQFRGSDTLLAQQLLEFIGSQRIVALEPAPPAKPNTKAPPAATIYELWDNFQEQQGQVSDAGQKKREQSDQPHESQRIQIVLELLSQQTHPHPHQGTGGDPYCTDREVLLIRLGTYVAKQQQLLSDIFSGPGTSAQQQKPAAAIAIAHYRTLGKEAGELLSCVEAFYGPLTTALPNRSAAEGTAIDSISPTRERGTPADIFAMACAWSTLLSAISAVGTPLNLSLHAEWGGSTAAASRSGNAATGTFSFINHSNTLTVDSLKRGAIALEEEEKLRTAEGESTNDVTSMAMRYLHRELLHNKKQLQELLIAAMALSSQLESDFIAMILSDTSTGSDEWLSAVDQKGQSPRGTRRWLLAAFESFIQSRCETDHRRTFPLFSSALQQSLQRLCSLQVATERRLSELGFDDDEPQFDTAQGEEGEGGGGDLLGIKDIPLSEASFALRTLLASLHSLCECVGFTYQHVMPSGGAGHHGSVLTPWRSMFSEFGELVLSLLDPTVVEELKNTGRGATSSPVGGETTASVGAAHRQGSVSVICVGRGLARYAELFDRLPVSQQQEHGRRVFLVELFSWIVQHPSQFDSTARKVLLKQVRVALEVTPEDMIELLELANALQHHGQCSSSRSATGSGSTSNPPALELASPHHIFDSPAIAARLLLAFFHRGIRNLLSHTSVTHPDAKDARHAQALAGSIVLNLLSKMPRELYQWTRSDSSLLEGGSHGGLGEKGDEVALPNDDSVDAEIFLLVMLLVQLTNAPGPGTTATARPQDAGIVEDEDSNLPPHVAFIETFAAANLPLTNLAADYSGRVESACMLPTEEVTLLKQLPSFFQSLRKWAEKERQGHRR